MSLRVLQVSCARPPKGMGLAGLIALWPTLADTAEAAASAGVDVTVLQSAPVREQLGRNGVTYRAAPELQREALVDLLQGRIAGLVRSHRPDVVHANGLESPRQVRALCAAGVPVLVQDHASQPWGRRAALLRRWGHRRVAGAAFTAAAQAEPFLRSRELPRAARIFAIPESSSRFTPGDRVEARARTGVYGSPALLWVGHLDANKDPLTMLCAVRRAMARLPGLRLWCAFGKALLLPEILQLLAEDPALAGRVHLLGRVAHDEVEALCRASDIFLSASGREGSGYALIEALACGLPVVASDIPAYRALTADGALGALFASGDAQAMAAAIIALADRAPSMRAEIRRDFEARLSFAVIGRRLAEAYAELRGQS